MPASGKVAVRLIQFDIPYMLCLMGTDSPCRLSVWGPLPFHSRSILASLTSCIVLLSATPTVRHAPPLGLELLLNCDTSGITKGPKGNTRPVWLPTCPHPATGGTAGYRWASVDGARCDASDGLMRKRTTGRHVPDTGCRGAQC